MVYATDGAGAQPLSGETIRETAQDILMIAVVTKEVLARTTAEVATSPSITAPKGQSP